MKIFAFLLCCFALCCCGNQAFDTGDYPKHVQLAQVIKQYFAGPRARTWSGDDQGGMYFPRLWISNHPEGVLAADDDDTTWLVRDAEIAIPYLVVDPFVNKSEDKIYISPIIVP